MRVAIVHDWLFVDGGAEQVLRELIHLYPDAELFTLFDRLSPEDRKNILGGRPTTSSVLNRFPWVQRYYRWLLPLYPLGVSSLDVSAYDLIISSSYSAVKNVRVRSGQIHLCYCHSPMRYAWDLREVYLSELPWFLLGVARWILARLQSWDREGSRGVTGFACNSQFVAARIRRAYGRDSEVIYPPVHPVEFAPENAPENTPTAPSPAAQPYYVTASRLVPYKNIDAIVRAFALRPDAQLIVMGNGPELPNLRKIAPSNVRFTGHVDRDEWKQIMRGARAFIAAAIEDFGLTPVEAATAGLPVLALRAGGYLETVVEGKSGLFFNDAIAESIAASIDALEQYGIQWSAEQCAEHGRQFHPDHFYRTFNHWVKSHMNTAP